MPRQGRGPELRWHVLGMVLHDTTFFSRRRDRRLKWITDHRSGLPAIRLRLMATPAPTGHSCGLQCGSARLTVSLRSEEPYCRHSGCSTPWLPTGFVKTDPVYRVNAVHAIGPRAYRATGTVLGGADLAGYRGHSPRCCDGCSESWNGLLYCKTAPTQTAQPDGQ